MDSINSEILKRLDSIEAKLSLHNSKPLTFNEACEYLNVSPSYLYKLTSSGLVPCYKPRGKMVYFNKVELDEWLLQNPVKTKEDIRAEASDFLLKRKREVSNKVG